MAKRNPLNLRKKKRTGEAKPYDPSQGYTLPLNPRGRGCGTVDLTPRYRKSSYAPWG